MHSSSPSSFDIQVEGMSCHSCETLIEHAWKRLPGVISVRARSATGRVHVSFRGEAPSLESLQQSLEGHHYRVRPLTEGTESAPENRPKFWRVVWLFAFVWIVGAFLSRLGVLKPNVAFGAAMGFGSIFLVGLVAASSSCVAVVGGLLLSSAQAFNDRYGGATRAARLRPVFLFILGRIIGYAVLGGALGSLGSMILPTAGISAAITAVAALVMFVMGLDMLGIAPAWMKRLVPRMPRAVAARVLRAGNRTQMLMPMILGAATFFLPCGFTQALQLYALSTGSFWSGALVLLAFALGTAPALLAVGYVSRSFQGKIGRGFRQFAGAAVVMLGLWNMQNAMAVAGYEPPWTTSGVLGPTAPVRNGVQVIRMTVDENGYTPSQFALRAGIPVRWEVEGTRAGGCGSVLMARRFGIQSFLKPGINIIEFTPRVVGQVAFSCSMGMFRGQFTITQ